MAVDTTDGCLPSKMSPLEDMEVGSEGQESYGLVSQEARGASPGSAGASQSQNQPSQEGDWDQSVMTSVVQVNLNLKSIFT